MLHLSLRASGSLRCSFFVVKCLQFAVSEKQNEKKKNPTNYFGRRRIDFEFFNLMNKYDRAWCQNDEANKNDISCFCWSLEFLNRRILVLLSRFDLCFFNYQFFFLARFAAPLTNNFLLKKWQPRKNTKRKLKQIVFHSIPFCRSIYDWLPIKTAATAKHEQMPI